MLIEDYIRRILKFIQTNPITILKAPVGSGKSTILPAAIANTGIRVYVSCPTIESARNLHKTVSDNFGYEYNHDENYGGSNPVEGRFAVGIAAEGIINYDRRTTGLVYMTTGHLKNRLLETINGGPGNIKICEVMIIDEAHMSSIDNTMIAAIWYQAAKLGKTVPRLVLMSGTLSNKWEIRMNESKVFVVPMGENPVEVRYIDQNFTIRDTYNKDGRFYDKITSVIVETLNDGSITAKYSGDILVFLAGKPEIASVHRKLDAIFKQKNMPIKLLRVYGGVEDEDRKLIYTKTNDRKVILSTNVAETSITIENIDIVIDTMLEKRAEEAAKGVTKLEVYFITKESADQRKGRTGRLRPGLAIRMMTSDAYLKLEDSKEEDIIRLPIHSELLRLIGRGADPRKYLNFVPEKKIMKALRILIVTGAITGNNTTQQMKITELGKFSNLFEIGIRLASILYNALHGNVLPYIAIVIVAAVATQGDQSYYYIPSDVKQAGTVDEYIKKEYADTMGYSDLESLLNIYLDLSLSSKHRIDYGKIVAYSLAHKLNAKKVTELNNNVNKIIKIIETYSNKKIVVGPFDPKDGIKIMIPYFAKILGDDIATLDGIVYRNSIPGSKPYLISDESVSKMFKQDVYPEKILVLSYGENKNNKFIKMAVDVPENLIPLPIDEPKVVVIKEEDILSGLSEEQIKEISELSEVDKEMYRSRKLGQYDSARFESVYTQCQTRRNRRVMDCETVAVSGSVSRFMNQPLPSLKTEVLDDELPVIPDVFPGDNLVKSSVRSRPSSPRLRPMSPVKSRPTVDDALPVIPDVFPGDARPMSPTRSRPMSPTRSRMPVEQPRPMSPVKSRPTIDDALPVIPDVFPGDARPMSPTRSRPMSPTKSRVAVPDSLPIIPDTFPGEVSRPRQMSPTRSRMPVSDLPPVDPAILPRRGSRPSSPVASRADISFSNPPLPLVTRSSQRSMLPPIASSNLTTSRRMLPPPVIPNYPSPLSSRMSNPLLQSASTLPTLPPVMPNYPSPLSSRMSNPALQSASTLPTLPPLRSSTSSISRLQNLPLPSRSSYVLPPPVIPSSMRSSDGLLPPRPPQPLPEVAVQNRPDPAIRASRLFPPY